ncbi:MAG: threonine synthase, partial [Microbacterium gubbeenense]
IDPHTADGVKVARDYVEDGVPMLVMETAKPAKFQETITEAIGVTIPLSDELQQMLEAPQHVVEMAADEKALRDYVSANAVR